MKKYVMSADTDMHQEIEQVVIDELGASIPQTGNIYIAKDGTFINLYPEIDTHEDLCWHLEEEYGYDLEYEDEEYFIREYGWIRLRSDPSMMIIELPSSKLTSGQWLSFAEWLEYCEEYHTRETKLYLNVCDGDDAEYNFGSEYFADDILKICRRYYSSGRLYASTELKGRASNKGENITMKKAIKAAETRTSELLDEFLKYHDDDMNRELHPNSFEEMYKILDKYDDSNRDDTVDVPFLKATPEDQHKMIDLIKFDPLPEEGTVDYCREMYYSALAGEWGETYNEDKAIVHVFENLFRAGLLNEEEFRTDL